MFSTFKGAARIALAVSIFSVLGLTAQAQTITAVGGGAPITCFPVTPLTTTVIYQFNPAAGQTLTDWSVQGDLGIVSKDVANNKVTIRSVAKGTALAGYGKGRLTAIYTVGGSPCGGKSLDIFKSFTPPDAISPFAATACVAPSGSYSFGYPPSRISTAAQIAEGIGIDTYTWSVFPATAATVSTNSTGEGNIVTVTPAAPGVNSVPFTLRVQVGQCNAATLATLPITLVTPAIMIISSIPATCLTTNTALTTTNPPNGYSFTLTINSVSGVTYTWKKPATWSIVPANAVTGFPATGTTQVVTIYPDRNAGEVSVKATAGSTCLNPTEAVFSLTRKLDPAVNTLTGPTCITLNPPTPFTYTLTGAPGNTKFFWMLPANWTTSNGTPVSGTTYSTLTPSIDVTPQVQAGTVFVYTEGCSSPMLSLITKVTGNQNCGLLLVNSDPSCGLFQVSITSGAGCPGPINGVTTYTFSMPGGTPATQTVTHPTNFAQFTNYAAVSTLSVQVRDLQNCVDYTTPFPIANAYHCPRPAPNPGGGNPPVNDNAHPAQLRVFPNPSGDEVTVDITEAATLKGDIRLTLTDATGKVRQQQTTTRPSATFNVRRLPTGVYLLRAELPDGQVVGHPVQVQH